MVECWKKLKDLAQDNNIVLPWIPSHSDIEGTERGDLLARESFQKAFLGPEPALDYPTEVRKK